MNKNLINELKEKLIAEFPLLKWEVCCFNGCLYFGYSKHINVCLDPDDKYFSIKVNGVGGKEFTGWFWSTKDESKYDSLIEKAKNKLNELRDFLL